MAEYLPPIASKGAACLCCGGAVTHLRKEDRIGVGFGFAGLTRDRETIWCEDGDMDWEELMTVEMAESIAMESPDSDWRIIMDGPLRGRTYQRQGDMKWVLVEENQGFA